MGVRKDDAVGLGLKAAGFLASLATNAISDAHVKIGESWMDSFLANEGRETLTTQVLGKLTLGAEYLSKKGFDATFNLNAASRDYLSRKDRMPQRDSFIPSLRFDDRGNRIGGAYNTRDEDDWWR